MSKKDEAKKKLIMDTLLKANKMQRQTAGIPEPNKPFSEELDWMLESVQRKHYQDRNIRSPKGSYDHTIPHCILCIRTARKEILLLFSELIEGLYPTWQDVDTTKIGYILQRQQALDTIKKELK